MIAPTRAAIQKGFTLIELLVVIAIIGILSSVVLVSLATARERAADASVKANLAAVRSYAQEFYAIQGSYSTDAGGANYAGDCLTNYSFLRMTYLSGTEVRAIADRVASAIEAAHQAGGASGKLCRISGNREEYLIAIRMRSGTYWCIDSAGKAKDIGSSLPASGVHVCP